MNVGQNTFRDALLDAGKKVPDGLHDAKGDPAGSRFAVYRNNVVVSLTEALGTAFPLVKKLIGTDSFSKMAAIYVRRHPPNSPLMMFYGAEMPAFLESFEPLQHIGYLPDCARLDIAMRQSYHAADATPVDQSVFQPNEDGEMLMRVALAPHVHVIRSDWPLFDIWRYNFAQDAPKPRATEQDVLVSRVGFDPKPHLLPDGAASWLARLNAGVPFGAAAEATLLDHPSFDLIDALTLALQTEALVN